MELSGISLKLKEKFITSFLSVEHTQKLGFLYDVEIEFRTACEMMSKMLTNDATVAESLCIFASLVVTCKCHCALPSGE